MARGISRELTTVCASTSSGPTCEIIVILGEGVTMAAPTAEHTEQRCVPVGALVRSAQMCNCAANKMSARSKASSPMFRRLIGISLVCMSLGRNGGVVNGPGRLGIAMANERWLLP